MSPTNNESQHAVSDGRSQRMLRSGVILVAGALLLWAGYVVVRRTMSRPAPMGRDLLTMDDESDAGLLTPAARPRDVPTPDEESHPLDPALQIAREGLEYLRRDVNDYTAVVVKRELVNGRILGPDKMQLKIRCGRQQNGQVVTPFSIYLKFLAPKSRAGREVIWVQNQNRGNLIAHETGFKRHLGRLSLDPEGFLAMQGQRYPIQCIGFDFLVRELLRRGERDRQHGICEVEIDPEATLIGRPCTKVEVRHPTPKPHFDFSLARIFVDRELGVPIHYAAYTWPSREGGRPVLLEEYTYVDVRLNVGLTDTDFDPDNPEYDFP